MQGCWSRWGGEKHPREASSCLPLHPIILILTSSIMSIGSNEGKGRNGFPSQTPGRKGRQEGGREGVVEERKAAEQTPLSGRGGSGPGRGRGKRLTGRERRAGRREGARSK